MATKKTKSTGNYAKKAIASYLESLKLLSPDDLAELSSTIQGISSKMFPQSWGDVQSQLDHIVSSFPAPVPDKHPHPYRLPEGISPRHEQIDAQMMTLKDLLEVAYSAKTLGDNWDFVVQYCLKLADEIVPDEKEPK